MHPVPAGYPTADITGPYIVGCLLNWGLFGTLSVQLYLYYLAFPNDRRFIKCLVYGIYVIEFVQTILVTHDAFAAFGYGFGDMDVLSRLNFSWLTGPVLSAVASCAGQVFYAYRIYIVSESRILSIFIICVSLTSSVVAIIIGIGYFEVGVISDPNNRKACIAIGISCGATALCDILIAISMTYYLMRRTTKFRRTRLLVTRVIRLTIETGSVTAVVALLCFVLFVLFPHQAYFATPGLLMAKLYANCVYMVLNSRFQIIGGRDTYMSSTDISITTTMIRGIISQPAEDAQPVEGMQGQVPVVAISHEIFNDNYEMGQDRPPESCTALST